jgi:hypothetical protein
MNFFLLQNIHPIHPLEINFQENQFYAVHNQNFMYPLIKLCLSLVLLFKEGDGTKVTFYNIELSYS